MLNLLSKTANYLKIIEINVCNSHMHFQDICSKMQSVLPWKYVRKIEYYMYTCNTVLMAFELGMFISFRTFKCSATVTAILKWDLFGYRILFPAYLLLLLPPEKKEADASSCFWDNTVLERERNGKNLSPCYLSDGKLHEFKS